MLTPAPTPYDELNQILARLVTGAQELLGASLVGVYLQGSFAVGDADEHSDVDFLVVVEEELSATQLAGLQTLHGAIYDLPSPWAQHLDGSYAPRAALRPDAPTGLPWPYLGNTSRVLVPSAHDNTLVVRWVVRERGVTLAGPAPEQLLEPVDPEALRREVCTKMRDWAAEILADAAQMNDRWYQPYAVLSYCRMLQTLETGAVHSKPAGARWAQARLNQRWSGLIARAWAERPDPSAKVRQRADPLDFAQTLAFIGYALGLIEQPGGT